MKRKASVSPSPPLPPPPPLAASSSNTFPVFRSVLPIKMYSSPITGSAALGVKELHERRVIVKNLPRNLPTEQILSHLQRILNGVGLAATAHEILKDPSNNSLNRGFAFFEFATTEETQCSLRVLNLSKIGDRELRAELAYIENNVSDEEMSRVRNLFVRNLHPYTTESELFERMGGKSSGVESVRVNQVQNIAFVNFASREQAAAVHDSHKEVVIHGNLLDITWAKPKKTTPGSAGACGYPARTVPLDVHVHSASLSSHSLSTPQMLPPEVLPSLPPSVYQLPYPCNLPLATLQTLLPYPLPSSSSSPPIWKPLVFLPALSYQSSPVRCLLEHASAAGWCPLYSVTFFHCTDSVTRLTRTVFQAMVWTPPYIGTGLHFDLRMAIEEAVERTLLGISLRYGSLT